MIKKEKAIVFLRILSLISLIFYLSFTILLCISFWDSTTSLSIIAQIVFIVLFSGLHLILGIIFSIISFFTIKKALIFNLIILLILIVGAFFILLNYNISFSETHGKVVDENGIGIPYAKVEVRYFRIAMESHAPILIKDVTTNENGEFYVEGITIRNKFFPVSVEKYKSIYAFADNYNDSGKRFSSRTKEVILSLNKNNVNLLA